MSVEDYYSILGVSEDASIDEIKKVFRSKARELHPDVSDHPDAENEFKKVNEAYSVLSNPDKRKEYDLRRSGVAPFPGGFSGFPGFGDIFSDFFSGPRRQEPRHVPHPIEVSYSLPLYQALVGGKITIRYEYKSPCIECDGTGVSEWSTCVQCRGSGSMNYNQGTVFIRRSCPACGGRGKEPKKSCGECNGDRFFTNEDSVELVIEPGSGNSIFQFNNKGHVGSDTRGQVIVRVLVDIPDLSGLSEEHRETLKELLS